MGTLAKSNDSFLVEVTTSGGGSGSADTEDNLIGIVSMVDLEYNVSVNAGTTVTISWIPPDEGAAAKTLAVVTGKTNIRVQPVIAQYNGSGSVSANVAAGIVGKIRIAVASAAGAYDPAVTARIVMLK